MPPAVELLGHGPSGQPSAGHQVGQLPVAGEQREERPEVGTELQILAAGDVPGDPLPHVRLEGVRRGERETVQGVVERLEVEFTRPFTFAYQAVQSCLARTRISREVIPMPVEFLGIAATNNGSETTPRSGAGFDKDYTLRLARAHEDHGWDRVLFAYGSGSPDPAPAAAYIASRLDRLQILLAHRPNDHRPTALREAPRSAGTHGKGPRPVNIRTLRPRLRGTAALALLVEQGPPAEVLDNPRLERTRTFLAKVL
ncbi:LLM class flavin-dependent oxidoreductase [Streptomyces sp. NPDC008343]|uniref:LLM class flavin-dependent oxidoreductase n=1 Tax=Streptomyces sp. NPDC008343 TaxID=3364828 RepID=UPI0036EFF69D